MTEESHLIQNEDWYWIQKIHEGDTPAFEKIFDKYKTKIINLAFRFTQEKTSAEDIAQEVFIKIYEKKVKMDPKSKFSTWLYRVTVNAALDVSRKKKHLPDSLNREIPNSEGDRSTLMDRIQDPRATPNTVMARTELAVLVQREIKRLPEKLRLPILLYQFEEMPYREIAAILDITEKAVEKRLYHARDLLKKRLLPYL